MRAWEELQKKFPSAIWRGEFLEKVTLHWWCAVLQHAALNKSSFTYFVDPVTRRFLDSQKTAAPPGRTLPLGSPSPRYFLLIHPEFLFLSCSAQPGPGMAHPVETGWSFSPVVIHEWFGLTGSTGEVELHDPGAAAWKHQLECVSLLARETQEACTEIQFLNTQLGELEEKVLHIQKMENIGLLARNIGHDLNNLMSPITGYSQFLKTDLPADSPLRRYAEHIEKAAEKCEPLIQQLLNYAPIDQIQFTHVDLRALIEEAVALLRRKFEARQITVKTDLPASACRTDVVPDKILESLVLALLNALEASPQKGSISVKLSLAALDEAFKARHPKAARPAYFVVSIADHGHGMTPEVLARVFDPFFSTKMPGPGTGLGLPIVEGILKFHKGFIELESAPGRGTEVSLFVPVLTQPAAPGLPVGREPVRPAHKTEFKDPDKTLRVLLAEDEQPTQQIIAALLERNNCKVDSVTRGEEAIERLQKDPNYDLLVLDVMMPGMGGFETFGRLRESGSKVPVIISTGFSKDWHVAEMLRQGALGVLRKPYTISELAEALEWIRPRAKR